ncbi:MAG TPA: MATE family efflux transporter [Candidatus Limivivens intestinipullorum]|uniref:MATE family efflux transporter n=1 Tax=Candidatus Limivivens intestinipullorum TaxID=2840858 RepID=A0A9D1JL63_9FIRM|nr:MATE family efflux transporter [Candidatus Limivivens intestinipullorum]
MQNDMTKGSPLRLIILFTIPVFIGNLFQNFYNLVDSIIVGQFLGVNALAAVGTTGTLTFLVIGWINGMTSGFAIMLAQSFGAGDEKKLRHYMSMSIYLCVAMAVLLTGGLLTANSAILRLINTPDNIFADTKSYIAVIYAGLPVTIAYNMLAGTCRALGDSRTPLIFLIISSLLNIVLDLLLVAVIPMGVAGAAYATVISQGVSAVLCFFYVKRKYKILGPDRESWRFSMRSVGNLIMMGMPMGLQFSITAIGTMMVQSSVNLLGATYIAAYSAAGKIQNIVVQLFPSLGMTLATYVGQNSGAGNYKRIRDGVRMTELICLGGSVICGVLIYFFGGEASRFFVTDTTGEVKQICDQLFHITAWFFPFLGTIFIYRNTLQGLGDGLVPMLGGVFELAARALLVSLLAPVYGFVGICLCDPGAWIAALIPLVPVYMRRMRKLTRTMNANA